MYKQCYSVLFKHIIVDRLYILIVKYEMRHKNQSFLRKYLSIFKEEMCENVKMEITESSIKIFIIILKRGNQNTTNYKYKNSIEQHCFYILNVFLHIKQLALHAIPMYEIQQASTVTNYIGMQVVNFKYTIQTIFSFGVLQRPI